MDDEQKLWSMTCTKIWLKFSTVTNCCSVAFVEFCFFLLNSMVGAKSDGLDSGHPNSNHASRGHFCSGLNRLPLRDTTHPQTVLSETSFVALKNGKPTRESSLFRVAS